MTTAPYPPTVLVDVDGTVSDSLPGIQSGVREALGAIGWPEPDEAFMDRIAGPPMYDSLRSLGMDEPTAAEALRIYRAQQHRGGWADTRMFDGWPELLRMWRGRGWTVATATSKGGHFARKVLGRFGVLDGFDFIGAADDGGDRSAKVDVVEHTLRVLGLPARRSGAPDGTRLADAGIAPLPGVVMIGDRSHDIDGAHAFGVPAVAVGWGYGDGAERASAEAVAADAADLDARVRALLGHAVA
ncbi:HAD hydrolase-like protein [Corynebacterium sp. 335C]